MSEEKSERCNNCHHFQPDLQNLQQGTCCAHPPTLAMVGPGNLMSVFPAVQRTNRCGEHEPKHILTGL